MPILTAKQVVAILRKHDFEESRQSGSHLRLVHKDGRAVTVPMHTGDIRRSTLRMIITQSELGIASFTKGKGKK
ncbi:MAG: type II toxin-antitoxin system HicA family toxin [Gaiellales bacterium]